MKYYFGTDRINDIDYNLAVIKNTHFKSWKAGYTSLIGKNICAEKIREMPELPYSISYAMIHHSSLGAVIYSVKNKDFENAYCYDRKSAYPAILCQPVPYSFKRVDRYKPQTNKIHWGKITIKNLKAKDINFLPLYRGKKYDKEKVYVLGKRILAATEYSYYGYIEHELELLSYAYTYDEIKISYVYEVTFCCLPQETINAIIELFNYKENNKNGKNYAGVKQMLNRIYGYFLTVIPNGKDRFRLRDKKIPYSIGTWVTSKQRIEMLKMFKKIGKENIIAGHTDSIIATKNCDEIVEKINEEINIYKKMGHWIGEAAYKKICYFSNVTAKYIDNQGELKMKHGGISDLDMDLFLKNTSYDEINEYSPIWVTRGMQFKQTNKGFIKIHIKEKMTLVKTEKEEFKC